VNIKIYVEGGGHGPHSKALQTACRRGFHEFFKKAGMQGMMPRISACGTRRLAYEDFCNALDLAKADDFIVLLVDSEDPVATEDDPWEHLIHRQSDQWDKPPTAAAENAHLMVQCMESWFIADKETLRSFYGQGFRESALPSRPNIEEIPKDTLYDGLKNATKDTITKGQYSKGKHSFDILALINPDLVRQASQHADRLLRVLMDKAVTQTSN